MLAELLKSLGKKGKTLKIARNSLKRKEARKSKKARKRRLGNSLLDGARHRFGVFPPHLYQAGRVATFMYFFAADTPWF